MWLLVAAALPRILFAHQSVGADLVEGLRQLGVQLDLDDYRVPENGDPLRKFASFAERVDRATPDVAALKLCYVDFDARTDAHALFAKYRETIEALRARHPKLRFVHVTTPLTVVQRGPKAWIKALLGRPPAGLVENERRNEYNALLRATYGGSEPVFDLANLEGGTALAPEYTDDGAHLKPSVRPTFARAFADALAASW